MSRLVPLNRQSLVFGDIVTLTPYDNVGVDNGDRNLYLGPDGRGGYWVVQLVFRDGIEVPEDERVHSYSLGAETWRRVEE